MKEQELKAFIKVVTTYFESVTGTAPVMGIPYIKSAGTGTLDYTGIIGISGLRKGCVYLTAGRDILTRFGRAILGDDPLDDEALWDLVGEMTNTVAGNMREVFGSSFLISVPIVMKGKVEDIMMRLKPPVFIIPLTWQDQVCHLAIGLE